MVSVLFLARICHYRREGELHGEILLAWNTLLLPWTPVHFWNPFMLPLLCHPPWALQRPPLWPHSTPQMSTHACAPLDGKLQRLTVKNERRPIMSWFSNPNHHRQYPKLEFTETVAPHLYLKSGLEFRIQESQGERKRSWKAKACEYTGDGGYRWTDTKRNSLNKDREAKMQRMLSAKSSVWLRTKKCRREGKKGSMEKVSTDFECQTNKWIYSIDTGSHQKSRNKRVHNQ